MPLGQQSPVAGLDLGHRRHLRQLQDLPGGTDFLVFCAFQKFNFPSLLSFEKMKTAPLRETILNSSSM
jgi:hypothetical protein